MKDKVFLNNSIINLFFIIILLVPIYWLSSPNVSSKKSIIEGRSLDTFPPLSYRKFKTSIKRIIQGKPQEAKELFFEQFISGSYQNNFEKATTDQFPFRTKAINIAKVIDRSVIRLAYFGLSDALIPSDMKSGLYVVTDGSILINGVAQYSNSSVEAIDSRIDNYENLITRFPEINFYMFYHERLLNSPYHPLNSFFGNADNRQTITYFEKNKPQQLKMEKFMLTKFDDHQRYYFRTDHHWNIHGVMRAYDGIYNLLKTEYRDISPQLQDDNFITFPEIKFLGSWARSSYYPIKPDKFEVLDVHLPPFEIYDNEKLVKLGKMEEYLDGQYSLEPYKNHYGDYYGYQRPLLEIVSFNGSERNLLLFGSSFTKPLFPLLASHYYHTYYVDLRSYKNFSMEEFLRNHNIDDVLVIGDNSVAFLSAVWKINP